MHFPGYFIAKFQGFLLFSVTAASFMKEENLECQDMSKMSKMIVSKMQQWAIRLGIEIATCQSSAMLYQVSYGGRCREHGHEFSIYNGINAD